MPEMNQENNINVESNVTPVVPVEPVNPVVDIVPEPVVDVAPAVEIPTVEVKEEVVEIAEAPVVEIAPAEVVVEAAPVEAPVMVNEIPEVLPVNTEVVPEPVVTVTPETPVVEVVPAEVPVVAEAPVAPEVPVTPEVVTEAPVVETIPVIETTPEVVDDIPVIETAPAVEETPVSEPVVNNVETTVPVVETQPVETAPVETPVATTSEENNIINGVVSDVTPTETPAAPEVAGSVPATPEAPKKESKKVLIVAILGVLLVLVGVAVACYFFVFSKPQFLFKKSLDIFKSKLVDTAGSSAPMQVDFSFQTNLTSSDETLKPMFENINKLYLETSVYVDLQNKIEFMKLNSKYKDQAFFNADMYVEKENAFVKLDGIFDKYIKVILEEDIFKENESDGNAVIVVESALTALEESLKDEYFTKVKKTVNLDNIVKEVTANTLVINGGNIIPFLTDIVSRLKNDDAFLTALSKMENIEKTDLVAALDQFLADIGQTPAEMLSTINYQLSFYTEGLMTPVGIGVVYEDKAYDLFYIDNLVSVLSTVDNSTEVLMNIRSNEDKYVVELYLGEETLSFTIGFKVIENPQFTKPDVSNFVEADKLTQEDSLTIMGGITQTPGVTAFMTDFQEIIALIQMMMSMDGGMGQPEMDFDVNMDMDSSFDMSDGTLYLE